MEFDGIRLFNTLSCLESASLGCSHETRNFEYLSIEDKKVDMK